MGYSTDFEGKITIDPPLNANQITEINKFCEERHGGGLEPFPGMPGFWCDYEVPLDGDVIKWNGSEKSYNMTEWMTFLIKEFFRPYGRTLNGTLEAQGDSSYDRWVLVVRNNEVTREEI